MKQFWKDFILRGLLAASGGPVVLAIIYGISGNQPLSPDQVCVEILTITLLAFIAAGMTAIYQAEKLPLPMMILLHGGGLYIAYILTYLINGWLENSLIPILVFSGIFLVGYGIIWLIIYFVEKRKADKLNKLLKD